ncbi:hypothetical protein DPEC_G00088900 [Dallia pectoralis]|uniref:Uncharacterized protein n=1 Tax=Dallia pectoralis TaxID=75939 RepID=A0ACC2H140_DALPE|nr:hypothetical protein DPEC_G00088900 [Dallia pectoralis]
MLQTSSLKNIQPETLTFDLQLLRSVNCSSTMDPVDNYNNTLKSTLDLHALVNRTVTFCRSAALYTVELGQLQAAGRAIERRYKATGLTVHKLAYGEH